MNPTNAYHLGHGRLADLHREARRDTLASAVRQARRSGRPTSPVARRPTVLTRWAQRLGRVPVS